MPAARTGPTINAPPRPEVRAHRIGEISPDDEKASMRHVDHEKAPDGGNGQEPAIRARRVPTRGNLSTRAEPPTPVCRRHRQFQGARRAKRQDTVPGPSVAL